MLTIRTPSMIYRVWLVDVLRLALALVVGCGCGLAFGGHQWKVLLLAYMTGWYWVSVEIKITTIINFRKVKRLRYLFICSWHTTSLLLLLLPPPLRPWLLFCLVGLLCRLLVLSLGWACAAGSKGAQGRRWSPGHSRRLRDGPRLGRAVHLCPFLSQRHSALCVVGVFRSGWDKYYELI